MTAPDALVLEARGLILSKIASHPGMTRPRSCPTESKQCVIRNYDPSVGLDRACRNNCGGGGGDVLFRIENEFKKGN